MNGRIAAVTLCVFVPGLLAAKDPSAAVPCQSYGERTWVLPDHRARAVAAQRENVERLPTARIVGRVDAELLSWAVPCQDVRSHAVQKYCEDRTMRANWPAIAAGLTLLSSRTDAAAQALMNRAFESSGGFVEGWGLDFGVPQTLASWWKKTRLDQATVEEVMSVECRAPGEERMTSARAGACSDWLFEQVARRGWTAELRPWLADAGRMQPQVTGAVCAYPVVEGYKHILRRVDSPVAFIGAPAESCAMWPMCGREHEDDAFVEAVRWFLREHGASDHAMKVIRIGLENRGCALVSTKPVTIDCSARGKKPERSR